MLSTINRPFQNWKKKELNLLLKTATKYSLTMTHKNKYIANTHVRMLKLCGKYILQFNLVYMLCLSEVFSKDFLRRGLH